MSKSRVPIAVLLAIIFAHLLHHSEIVLLSPLYPFIREQISISYGQIGLLGMILSLCLVGGQILVGWGVDRWGSRVWILWGLMIPVLGFLVIAVAIDFLWLLAGQLIIGIGLSGYHPAGFSVIRQRFSKTQRGQVTAVHSMGGSIGIALTPILAVALALGLGSWRNSIVVLMLPNFAVMGFVWIALRDHRPHLQEPYLHDSKGRSGMNAQLGVYLLVTSGRYGVLRVLGTFIPLYATDVFQTDFLFASGILSIFNLIGVATTLIGGVLSDRRGRKILLLASTGTSILPMILALTAPTIEIFALAVMILGITFFIGQAADAAYLTEVVPTNAQGKSFGMILSMQMVSAAFSSVLFGLLGDLWGLQTGFVLLTLLLISASLASMRLPKTGTL